MFMYCADFIDEDYIKLDKKIQFQYFIFHDLHTTKQKSTLKSG